MAWFSSSFVIFYLLFFISLIGTLVWAVRQACQLENDCVSVERVMEYTKTEQEASWDGNKG